MWKKVSVLLLGLGVGGAALASDGTMTFSGKILDSSCTISGSPGTGANVNVVLPTVSKSTLGDTSQIAGTTPFQLNLVNCPINPTGPSTVGVHFEMGPTINTATGGLINQAAKNSAQNVEVALLNSQSQAIHLSNNQSSNPVNIDPNGNATLNYFAAYRLVGAKGSVVAGAVQTSVQYSLVYQ